MSTLANKLSRLAYMAPSDPAAPRLRAEIKAMQEQEEIEYARQLVREGRAGEWLMAHHYRTEAQKGR